MKFEAILFDCDGVLVDSEPITNGVLRDMLEEGGWSLTAAECMRVFVGKAVRDERSLIESRTGRPLTEDWMAEFYARRNVELQAHLQAITGANGETALLTVLRNYDTVKKEGHFTVSSLQEDAVFQTDNGKLFRRGKVRRKRIDCVEIKTGLHYIFSPITVVKLIEISS